jgi:carbonic anhydrase/acetyltransferase-like protein (isoleucine patch superfamily)
MESSGRQVAGGGFIYPFRGIWPTLGEGVFIAPGARVIGDVHIGAESSIWFNCVLRGDVNSIRIGARTNLQDGTVVHVTINSFPTRIGNDVLIGHTAIIHGCTLEDGAFVGMGATVMDGCVIEQGGMLAAGSLLTPGKVIKPGQLWAGLAARNVRDLTAEEVKNNKEGQQGYVKMAAEYLRG